MIGWIATIVIAWSYFKTSLNVVSLSNLAGIVASIPIALVVATSIFQMTIMQEIDAIARIVSLLKTIPPEDKIVQIMLINVGFGTLLTSLGAAPVLILPPIMLSLGYSPFVAIALPAIAMLTRLHLSTAEEIGAIGLIIAAASGIGGGFTSVISPAKLQNTAASIYRIGEESQVIRTTSIISLIITAIVALMTLVWAY